MSLFFIAEQKKDVDLTFSVSVQICLCLRCFQSSVNLWLKFLFCIILSFHTQVRIQLGHAIQRTFLNWKSWLNVPQSYVKVYFGNIKIEGTDNISNRITNFLPFFICSLELIWSPVVQRLAICPSVCKLFTFSSSHQEPLGQFQPNLRKIILGWRGFKFPQMKSHILFQGEILTKWLKYIDEPLSQFQQNLAQSILEWRGLKFMQIKGHFNSQKDIRIFYLNQCYCIIIALHRCVYWLELFVRWAMWPVGLFLFSFPF